MGVEYIAYCKKHDEYVYLDKSMGCVPDRITLEIGDQKHTDVVGEDFHKDLEYMTYYGMMLMSFVREHSGCEIHIFPDSNESYYNILGYEDRMDQTEADRKKKSAKRYAIKKEE